MRIPAMLLLSVTAFASTATDGRAQYNTDPTRLIECSELVDCLLSPQGPHVFQDKTWRRLVQKTSESGPVFYFLFNDGVIPSADQGSKISLVFTTAVVGKYWPHAGDSPRLTPATGGCAKSDVILPTNWDWGGWAGYRAMLNKVGLLEKANADSTFFCTNENDVREELKKQLEKLPQAYSPESLRQNFKALLNEQKQDNEQLGKDFANLPRNPDLLQALAAQLVSNEEFVIKILENEKVSRIISGIVARCIKASTETADALKCR
jgi:hypothetical protein